MIESKMREALEQVLNTALEYKIEESDMCVELAREALDQPADVGLTDEECLIAMHAALSENLQEDDRVSQEVFLAGYKEKNEDAMALLAGLRAVIAAHEAKKAGGVK